MKRLVEFPLEDGGSILIEVEVTEPEGVAPAARGEKDVPEKAHPTFEAAMERVQADAPEWVGEAVATALTKGVKGRPTAEKLARTLRGRESVGVAPIAAPGAVDVSLAEEHFDRGVAYQEQNHLDESVAYERQGRLDDAINEKRAVPRFNPGYAKAHYNLGVYNEQRAGPSGRGYW